MSTPVSHHLADNIQCHCWNKGATELAYSPATKEIIVAKFDGKKFTTDQTLVGHDARVLGLDWALESDRIVSCSEDRNALVWTRDDKKKFQPVLVLLRINFAATDVKWSPNELKFACSSCDKCVAICKFNEEQNWWASEHVKGFRSAAMKVAWSPDSMTVAVASTDYKVRIVNTFMKGIDQKGAGSPFSSLDLSKPDLKIGKKEGILFEYESVGWVRSVSYTPSGNTVAFVSQDSSIGFIEATGAEPSVQIIKTKTLPFLDVLCLSDDKVVAVGHDYSPYLFVRGGNGWEFKEELDKKTSATAGKTKMSAMDMFKSKTTKGTADVKSAVEEIPTVHKFDVNCIRAMKYDANWNVLEFSTSGYDGNIVFWKA